MTTFVVISPASSAFLDAFNASIERVFPGRHFEISSGQFVAVDPDLSAVQVGERLGPEGQIGQFVVFSTDSHYGWHRKDLWEWLKVKADQ